jgi:hypothetical protein
MAHTRPPVTRETLEALGDGVAYCAFWPGGRRDAPGLYARLKVLRRPDPSRPRYEAALVRFEEARSRAEIERVDWWRMADAIGVEVFINDWGNYDTRYIDGARRSNADTMRLAMRAEPDDDEPQY